MATTPDLLAVPPFLHGVVEAPQGYWRTGEWTLDIPGRTSDQDFFFPIQWVAPLVQQFCAAFPWTSMRSLTFTVTDHLDASWTPETGALDSWLAQFSALDAYCGGG